MHRSIRAVTGLVHVADQSQLRAEGKTISELQVALHTPNTNSHAPATMYRTTAVNKAQGMSRASFHLSSAALCATYNSCCKDSNENCSERKLAPCQASHSTDHYGGVRTQVWV
ncbi:hypothetical protein RRG08_023301 [Elysia crispata]|uniref:Uncharacterized protein n=1 Tax=Elysia crispata TaxID=231223 RepID=A0AAE1BCF9_9GAST|nr:hypothetical protein RRG08_023301 [Elysia crispata]